MDDDRSDRVEVTATLDGDIGGAGVVSGVDLDAILRRVADLEQRVAALEDTRAAGSSRSSRSGAGNRGGSAAAASPPPGWTVPYEVADLEPPDSWIEFHEQSARPTLHRMIRTVVEVEGPITETLALRRIREAWGLRRAGARVQQTFEQAAKQLAFNGKLDRAVDGVLSVGGDDVPAVRVPSDDERSRRAVDEIPPGELELALLLVARAAAGDIDGDELTATVARTFGWSRRGAEIQAVLDARLEALITRGALERFGTHIRPVGDG